MAGVWFRIIEKCRCSKRRFSPDEAGKILGLPAYTVRRLIQSRKLRARSTGGRYIIPGSALVEYLDGSDTPMRHPGGDAA